MESQSELSNDEDVQTLQPIKNLLPPNQIITKNYDPDIKPSFLLLKKQEKLQKQKLSSNSIVKHQYCQKFQENDTLGYQYSNYIQKNLIYMKFNNTQFMKCPTYIRTKYLAGLFIPLESLVKPQVLKAKNVYKTLQGLQYIDYKSSIQNSFERNCISSEPQIKFSSNYQSSNLFMAIKKGQFEYDLILQNDINSKGTTQWFNFAVSIYSQAKYKFNIVNLTKSSSLYQRGMRICYYSFQNKLINNKSWTRGGQNIAYFKNQINRQGSIQNNYYTLHFQYDSPFKYDTIIFSYCYPYTLTDMEKFFSKVTYKKMCSSFKIQKIKLCQSVSGFPVNIFQISLKKIRPIKNVTSPHLFTIQTHNNIFKQQNAFQSKAIVFMARQHSGQTQGSFILEGITQFLLQNNQYEHNKQSYTFYVIPIVNVDGVYYGNYRTNLSGADLNRIWRNPRKDFHSQIYNIKKFLIKINKTTPISLIIDIHGHSSSLNSFFYGNTFKPKDYTSYNSQNQKLFPYFCSRRIKQISFNQSTFGVSQDKKNSARVVLGEMFPKALVYTFQNSFYGFKKGKHIEQYTIQVLKKIGKQLMISYLQYQKIIERNVFVKQKWEKQIQIFCGKLKKGNQEVVSESDSEAQKQLITFQNQVNIIQGTQFKSFGEEIKLMNTSHQIYNNTRLHHKRNRNTIKNRQKSSISPPMSKSQILTDSIQQANQFSYRPQGFLSIVKIDTKQNPTYTLNAFNILNQKRKKLMGNNYKRNQIGRQTKYSKQNKGINQYFKLLNEKQYLKQKKQDYFVDGSNFFKVRQKTT